MNMCIALSILSWGVTRLTPFPADVLFLAKAKG